MDVDLLIFKDESLACAQTQTHTVIEPQRSVNDDVAEGASCVLLYVCMDLLKAATDGPQMVHRFKPQ